MQKAQHWRSNAHQRQLSAAQQCRASALRWPGRAQDGGERALRAAVRGAGAGVVRAGRGAGRTRSERQPPGRRRRARHRGAAARHPPGGPRPCPRPPPGPWRAPRARAAGQRPGREAGPRVRAGQEAGAQAARRAARPARPAGAEPGRGLASAVCAHESLILAAVSDRGAHRSPHAQQAPLPAVPQQTIAAE